MQEEGEQKKNNTYDHSDDRSYEFHSDLVLIRILIFTSPVWIGHIRISHYPSSK